MIVIVPSRGRPENIARLKRAWIDTQATAQLVVAVDDDDPSLDGYLKIARDELVIGKRLRLGPTLNSLATVYAEEDDMICFMGDDHLPRTLQWDQIIGNELQKLGTGIVYGNDLVQGVNLPTAVSMTSDIIRTLGFMSPPVLIHHFIDNFWMDLGNGIGRLSYLPDVIIEHLHPIAENASVDKTYEQAWANSNQDAETYGVYIDSGQLSDDIQKVKAILK